jgi:hypothetical protein
MTMIVIWVHFNSDSDLQWETHVGVLNILWVRFMLH